MSATRTYVAEGQWEDIVHEGRRPPEFWDLVSRWWAYRTLSDASGRFSLTLPTDEWALLAEAEGLPSGAATADNSDASGPPLEIVLTVEPCWFIQIVDEAGNGIAEAEVTVRSQYSTTDSRREHVTNRDGRVEVCDVQPAGARVMAGAPGKVHDWTINETGESPLVFTLGDGATLVGTLLPPVPEEDGCWIFGMGFVGNGIVANELRFATDEHGHFEVDGVPPGEVSLQIACSGFQPAMTHADIEPGDTVDLGILTHELPSPRGNRHKNVWSPFAD